MTKMRRLLGRRSAIDVRIAVVADTSLVSILLSLCFSDPPRVGCSPLGMYEGSCKARTVVKGPRAQADCRDPKAMVPRGDRESTVETDPERPKSSRRNAKANSGFPRPRASRLGEMTSPSGLRHGLPPAIRRCPGRPAPWHSAPRHGCCWIVRTLPAWQRVNSS